MTARHTLFPLLLLALTLQGPGKAFASGMHQGITAAPTVLAAQDTVAGVTTLTAAAGTPRSRPAAAEGTVLLPPPAQLTFDVTGKTSGFGYHATATLLWQHDAFSYHAHQEIKVLFLGSRSQDSVGRIARHGLEPQRFADRSRKERVAELDFANGRVTFNTDTPPAPIEPGAQDRLSVFLQLGGMLAATPRRYPPGTQIAMTTVSARAADIWTFTVKGAQRLELPAGMLSAIPLQRLPRRDHDQEAQVWLAPSLGYLPVRIRITEPNGDFAELNLRSHSAP